MGVAPYKPLPCLVSLFSFGNGIDFALHQPDALKPWLETLWQSSIETKGVSLSFNVCQEII